MAKRQSMTECVLEALRNDIINWNYEENDVITEAEISKKFGVSKTPSREALNYLCVEGFLESLRDLAKQQVSMMEGNSYQEYSARNMQFHMSVAYLSRNSYLMSALESTLNKLRRVLVKDWKSSKAKSLMEAHLKLVDALIERNVERAQEYVEEEMEGVEYRLYFKRER